MNGEPFPNFDVVAKRMFDIVVSLLALVMLSPLLLCVCCILYFLPPHQVFFLQKRVGRSGSPFVIYKFCTMTDSRGEEVADGQFDLGNISRVTEVGSVLRKWKIDELPQLVNVLLGHMSLVGPRPEIQRWVDEYADQWKTIHQIRPGITDPASIVFRDESFLLSNSSNPEELYRFELLPAKLKIYKEYVDHHSLLGDVKIIFHTLFAIVNTKKKQGSI